MTRSLPLIPTLVAGPAPSRLDQRRLDHREIDELLIGRLFLSLNGSEFYLLVNGPLDHVSWQAIIHRPGSGICQNIISLRDHVGVWLGVFNSDLDRFGFVATRIEPLLKVDRALIHILHC
jgi:hypothetical protein